jgi:hypothetical protein
MAKLSKDDARFLEAHGIPLAAVFDASGMRTRDWKAAMREQGKLIAYGVTCLRGHSLKTRSGNCVRCNTANFAYALRSERAGYVYIARSANLKLIKVGFSNDPDNRVYIANLEGYGGAKDWTIRTWIMSDRAGRIELDVHVALKSYNSPRFWIRNWEEIEAREIYDCTLKIAQLALFAQLSPTEQSRVMIC